VRNETQARQTGDGLWSSFYRGELHASSADRTLKTPAHTTGRASVRARILRNEANKCSCFQTDDTCVRAKNEGPTHPRVPLGRSQDRRGSACQSPAMASGRCRMHGGASTGPRTAEGLARSRRSRSKHGQYSAVALAEQKRVRELLVQSRELLKQMQAG
jgi:hypothetical protein